MKNWISKNKKILLYGCLLIVLACTAVVVVKTKSAQVPEAPAIISEVTPAILPTDKIENPAIDNIPTTIPMEQESEEAAEMIAPQPTLEPTMVPTQAPVKPTEVPSQKPIEQQKPIVTPQLTPTSVPNRPTQTPVKPTQSPSNPTQVPSKPTDIPYKPTDTPTIPPQSQEKPSLGEVTVSVNAKVIGLGTLMERFTVKLQENDTAAHVVDRALKANGFTYSNTGTLNQNFYLASIKKEGIANNPFISDTVQEILTKQGMALDMNRYSVNSLGEFDFTNYSGWRYRVNGSYPGVGMSEYKIVSGDSIVLRYTLCLGYDEEY